MSTKKNLKPLVVILGPTASGKTDLAIKLAKKYHGEIICADSRTIYKGMDIGTAKAVPKIQNPKFKIQNGYIIEGIPHYMIDIVRPDQEFTVAQFKQQAVQIIKNIHKRGKIPFLAGGTGLYISAIVDNLEVPHVPPDKKLRGKLEKQAKKYGANYLYKKLLKLDPQSKKFIDKKNVRRIIRALEVCLKTKKPFSQLRQKGRPLFKILQIGIQIPRLKLYQRINQRVDKMMKMGLLKEVKKLAKKYSFNLSAMTGIGYRQIGLYLSRKRSGISRDKQNKSRKNSLRDKNILNETIELIKKDTRHYAKRQMTWFKRDKRIRWIAPNNLKRIQQLVKKFIIK